MRRLLSSLLISLVCSASSLAAAEAALDPFEEHVKRIAAASERAERERREQEALEVQQTQPEKPYTFFKYRKDGATAFSDRQPKQTAYEVIVYNSCYACNPISRVDWRVTKLYLNEFTYSISRTAQKYGVDPALVRAVIHAESNFNPMAKSKKGAAGLMQLMPGTAGDMGVTDVHNPAQNIEGGVKYLAYLMKRFDNDVTLVTAAYNAGPGAVERHGGVPPYKETKTYVFRVNILKQRYSAQMAALATNP